MECRVCWCEFDRSDRVPRVLFCKHTFCSPCLDKMSSLEGPLFTIPCPLCRCVTCVKNKDMTASFLWVDLEIWSYLPYKSEESPYELNDAKTECSSSTNLHSRQTGLKGALKKLQQVFKGRVKQTGDDDC